MLHSVATVPLAVTAGMLYARVAASSIRPGMCRLFAFTPVLVLLLVLPFSIPLYGGRGLAAFFLVWLGEFKLLLLAFGRGPLDPALRPLQFVFTAALPVKLRTQSPGATVVAAQTITLSLLSSGIKIAVMASAFRLLLRSKNRMHPYTAFTLHGINIYCLLDSLLSCLAVTGRALGMEMDTQFNKPYLSTSLRDFWGRRWNLVVSAVLRAFVYDPVRARHGVYVGVLATFLVSRALGMLATSMRWWRGTSRSGRPRGNSRRSSCCTARACVPSGGAGRGAV